MNDVPNILNEMNDRSREVFRRVVEGYLQNGEPVGSRSLTRSMDEKVSAATIRNVMQDLEFMGLIDSPHVSAGRVPTQLGLRMFVDSLLEVEDLKTADREKIESTLGPNDQDVATRLDHLGSALSAITSGASLVMTPKHEAPIKHIEFVSLAPERALVVLVFADGHVENRVFEPPAGQTPSSMREAANFLNSLAEGRTLSELRTAFDNDIAQRRQYLVETVPVTCGPADAAVNHQLFRAFRDRRIQIVLQHAERRLAEPTLTGQGGSGWRGYRTLVVAVVVHRDCLRR